MSILGATGPGAWFLVGGIIFNLIWGTLPINNYINNKVKRGGFFKTDYDHVAAPFDEVLGYDESYEECYAYLPIIIGWKFIWRKPYYRQWFATPFAGDLGAGWRYKNHLPPPRNGKSYIKSGIRSVDAE